VHISASIVSIVKKKQSLSVVSDSAWGVEQKGPTAKNGGWKEPSVTKQICKAVILSHEACWNPGGYVPQFSLYSSVMILSQVLEQGISKKCKYASSLIMHQNNVAYFSERTWNHCTMATDKEKNLQVLL
jgi:hypothetical protein